MRISLQWLSEWIGGPLPAPKDLAARLTMAGLEIEGVEAASPPLPGVIVGETPGSKLAKAEDVGTEVIDEGGLTKLLEGAAARKASARPRGPR